MSEWTAVIALAGTVFGGAGLEITRRWLSRTKEKDDTAKELRIELRDELSRIKAENKVLEQEVDVWKEKYWKQVEENITQRHT